jgi:hypothetical protein
VTSRGLTFNNKVTPVTSKVVNCRRFQPNLMVWNKPRWSNHPIFARKNAKLCQNKKTLSTTNGVQCLSMSPKRTHTLKHATNGLLTVSGHGKASVLSACYLDRGPWHGSKDCHCI